jgi:D-alanyl-D-alanine carboxypeptidase
MDAGVFGPEGGMISAAYDLSIFIKALFEYQVINSQSLGEMLEFVPCKFDQDYYNEYGLGLMNWETIGGTGYGHGGSLTGFSTEMFYFPEKKTTLIVLCNVGILGESPTTQHYQDFLIDLTQTVFE